MSEELPQATHSGTLAVMGVELKVHRLDDGRTVIEQEGVEALFQAMADGAPMSEDDALKIAKVIRLS